MNGTTDNETTIFVEKRRLKGAGRLRNRGLLVVVSENFFGRCFVIRESMTIVGRRAKCDIQIGDPLVSKVHCVITADNEGNFFIEDLDSKNSTFLNKKPVKKKIPVLYGDRIVIGNTIMRFFLEERVEGR
jgi:pSer/pThr/pTyr-binding forkhead associated (FHA) protein